MILGVIVQYVDGNQRIVHVSKLFSDNEDDRSLTCCVYGNCSCSTLDHALDNLTSNVLINITTDVTLSSLVRASDLENISIIGHNNPTVNCRNVNGMEFTSCHHLIIEDITWIGCGTDNVNHTKPGLSLSYSSNVTIQNCTFQQSVGQAVVLSEMSGDVNINNCKFVNNSHYRGHGAAIHYSSSTNNTINYSQFVLTIKNSIFSYNKMKSLVYLENKCNKIILNNSTFCYNQGTSIYAINHKIYLNGKILFENNTAEDGAGIYISDHSTVTFVNNSEVTFIQNSAKFKGGAVFLRNHSSIIFDQNSVVAFINNSAINGTVYSDAWSNVTFKETCHVTFSGNSATEYGAAIYSDNSLVTFTGNSNVAFSSNYVSNNKLPYNRYGGIICSNFSNISFEGSSTTLFINNIATNGGAIYSSDYGSISFKGSSTTTFSNNVAFDGGAIYYRNFGSISFKGNASTIFSHNTNNDFGGGSNKFGGGAIKLIRHVNMLFGGNSSTTFIDNNNLFFGGAIDCIDYCSISHEGNSTTVFNNNTADYGGAIYVSTISFNGNSTVVFSDNMANHDGGAVLACGDVSFNGNSNAEFRNNTANNNGGAILIFNGSLLTFNDNSVITCTDNKAKQHGGVFYYMNIFVGVVYSMSSFFVLFNGNSTVSLAHNEAQVNGGVMYCDTNCNITFSGFTNVSFSDNNAHNGGAGYFNELCSVTFKHNANVTFENNNALYGGAICLNSYTNITFNDNSIVLFKNNMATNDGGAIIIAGNSSIIVNDNTTITFTINNAQYGGAIFFDATHTTLAFNKNERNISFNHNTARIAGSHMYFDSTGSYASGSCLSRRIDEIKAKQLITTPPSKLQLFAPAICIDYIYDNNTAECITYHLKHIMLGEEINIPVYVSSYCYSNLPSYPAQFRLQGGNKQNYSISGSNQILLSGNDTLQGISIIGNNSLAKSLNYTMSIIMQDDRIHDRKEVSVNLTIQLTPCYPGFWQNSGSVKCECYNANNIVFCSGSKSTIKRGYWFGKVAEQPTVTICPVNYCDFTCCEASNGYYHLSPVRDNQCRSHRSGTACGSCTDGYTLSFDSTECVNVDSCTAGQQY